MAELSQQIADGTLPPEIPGPVREEYEPGTAYQPGNAVWVWSTMSRSWCPGTVDRPSKLAVHVTYEPTGQRGTAVDSVAPGYVARRAPAGGETGVSARRDGVGGYSG